MKNKMKTKKKNHFYFHFRFYFHFVFHFRFHFRFCFSFNFRFCLCFCFHFCFSVIFLVLYFKFSYGTSRLPYMCDIFLKSAEKHSMKSVIKTEVELMSWLSNIYLKIVHKNKSGACCNENNMGSEMELTSCSKDNGRKNVFYVECSYDKLHLSF